MLGKNFRLWIFLLFILCFSNDKFSAYKLAFFLPSSYSVTNSHPPPPPHCTLQQHNASLSFLCAVLCCDCLALQCCSFTPSRFFLLAYIVVAVWLFQIQSERGSTRMGTLPYPNLTQLILFNVFGISSLNSKIQSAEIYKRAPEVFRNLFFIACTRYGRWWIYYAYYARARGRAEDIFISIHPFRKWAGLKVLYSSICNFVAVLVCILLEIESLCLLSFILCAMLRRQQLMRLILIW